MLVSAEVNLSTSLGLHELTSLRAAFCRRAVPRIKVDGKSWKIV
jgi:hypothetical protein